MLRSLRTLGVTGSIVLGSALAAFGLFCLLTPRVWCDFRPMSPGGTCAESSVGDTSTVRHSTYEDQASDQLALGWGTVVAGLGLAVVVPLVHLVRGRSRAGGAGAVTEPPTHRSADHPYPPPQEPPQHLPHPRRAPGAPRPGQDSPPTGPIPRQGRRQPPPRPPHPRRPPTEPGP
ncbi:hypothetical protein [Nocardiopsis sp. Huas11]|uniref:hypothetical protein n=1 Tax=Nocardiopsis sp. Huas11 TaxID=2183912 RepID=UPI000EB4DAC3|nr:hypothetical protein [Nocardiopsis sp. Huas11]